MASLSSQFSSTISIRKSSFIDRRVYWLNFDLDYNHGRVLFGGVDTAKFIGKLAVLTRPPNPNDREMEDSLVGLSGVDILTPTSKPVQVSVSAEGVASLLDSIVPLSYLPCEIVSQIVDNVGAFHNGDYPLLLINCTHNPQARVTLILPRADGGAPVCINIPPADIMAMTWLPMT